MALERVDATFAAGANISIGKARTAALLKKPTPFFEEVIAQRVVARNDCTPLQGGVPLTADGEVIGGVGVSGAATAQQVKNSRLRVQPLYTPRPPQSLISTATEVTAAFSKVLSCSRER